MGKRISSGTQREPGQPESARSAPPEDSSNLYYTVARRGIEFAALHRERESDGAETRADFDIAPGEMRAGIRPRSDLVELGKLRNPRILLSWRARKRSIQTLV